MKTIVLVCGPAGIGKSTFSKRYRESHADELIFVISADDTRCELCGGYDKFPKGGNMLPVYDKMIQKAKILAAEHENLTILFDTTSLTDRRRMHYVNALEGTFDRFVLIMLRLHDYSLCLARNATRPKNRLVPETVIRDMITHYEEPSEETLAHFDVKEDVYMD